MGMRGGVRETAKHLHVSGHYIYNRARAGEIPFIKSGNKYIFDWELLEEFLRNEALSNIKKEEDTVSFGKLRRVTP